MSTPAPFVSISNQQIYDKLVTVEAKLTELTPVAQTVAVDHERLRAVELELAALRGAAKSLKTYKALLYPVAGAALGGLATAIIPLVVK